MRKRKDLDQYKPAGDGRNYVYQGTYYMLSGPEKQKKGVRMKLLALAFASLLLLVASGLSNPGGLRQLYVVIPYLVALYFAGKGVFQAIGIMMVPTRMTERQKNQTFQGLEHNNRVLFVFSLLLAFAQSAYFVFVNSKFIEGLMVALVLLVSLSSYLGFTLLRMHPCVEIPRDSGCINPLQNE